MKIQFRFLCRGLLLAAAVLPLANCSSTSPHAAYKPAVPMTPSVASGGTSSRSYPGSLDNYTFVGPGGRIINGAELNPVSRGLRYGNDPLSRTAIDDLIRKESSNPDGKIRKTSRQGLATQAGDETYSSLTDLAFYRKTTGQPDAVDSFHYNDETGAKAMADALGGGSKKRGTFSVAGGRLDVALKGSYSGPFERYEAGGKRIVIGSPGSNYEIFLSNQTKHAVEVVASVDSLDVMDGKTASVKKRGYVIPAKSELAIEGFRVNSKTVKGFVFGSVDDSAAAKAGAARNVGVIGLAVYDEDEAQATMARLIESQKRSAASPF